MDAPCIAVQEIDAERSFPLRLGMTEIFAGGQQPESIHNVRDLLLETARETCDISTCTTLSLLVQHGVERLGFQGCCRHTLPIDGVETTHRIAEGDKAFWKTGKSLV